MVDVHRIGSGVPRIPIRRADDLVEWIETLKIEAAACGLGTLAYSLDTALIEAKLREQHTAIALALPDELWRPVEDRN